MPHAAAISRDGLLLHNEGTGVKTTVKWQPDGTFLILTEQDSSPILDENARLRLAANDNRRKQRMRHVAEIPFVIYQRLRDMLGPPSENPEGWAKWLNDPDHKKLRIWEGKV